MLPNEIDRELEEIQEEEDGMFPLNEDQAKAELQHLHALEKELNVFF